MREIQAVFVDRDGTIGGNGHFIHPRDFTLFPFSKEAIKLLKELGLKIFAFTNQHRISRGEATLEEFVEQFSSYGFDDCYICPHAATEGCICHKPGPGMLITAAEQYGLDLTKCVVIGDVGSTDMLAAEAVGALKIIVRTGWGEGSLGPYRSKWSEVVPDYVATDFLDAARWIISNARVR